jgi:signal transduction histidine kinase
MIRNLILLFGTVVAVLLGLTAYHLKSVNTMEALTVPIFHWTDTSGTVTVAEVSQIHRFEPVRKRRINVGYTEAIHWFRFQLRPGDWPDELSFEIRNHAIDRVELFRVCGQTITSLGRTGSRFPFAQRPSPTKTFVYLLTPDASQPTDYYLRLDKRYENLATELILWRTSDFEDKEEREYFLWGLFAGVVGLIVLLAFLLYAATRDPVYSTYGLYVLALSLRQFADSGLGFQFLWPQWPAINHPDAVIQALWLYVPAMLQFQQHFLQLRTESKPVFWITQVLKVSFCGLFIGLVVGQITGFTETYSGIYRLVTLIHSVLVNCMFLVFPVLIAIALRTADTVKHVYAVGFSIQVIGQLLVIAQGLMRNQPDGVFFVDAYMILIVNFFVDLVIFAYLLAYRYRKSVDEQRRLQISLAQTQQHTNDAIIDLLESERQQVGNLLLSDVGGRLAFTRALLADLPPSSLQTAAMDLIQKTDDSLDQILRDSLPPDLIQKGLPVALSELVQQRNQAERVQLAFRYDDQQLSDPPFALLDTQIRQLYRITNELINNIIKHADATEGQVVLYSTREGWQLTVSDNGHGFDTSRIRKKDGIGLKNLSARAQTLDAALHIDSRSTGTTISLVMAQKIQTS